MNYVKSFDFFGVNAKEIPCITGTGAPTTSTAGAVGCFYMDTANGDVYKCTAVSGGVYTWAKAFGELSLGLHTDGLLYVFVDGAPVGNGIALEGGAIGDVIGPLDENNNIILTGELADGTYTLKYENADGTYTEIGSLVVAEAPEEPVYTNLAVPTDSSAQADWEAGNWCNESFIGGSSYSYRAAAGTSRVTTNTFAVENGDTVYVKGINFSTDTSTQTQVALLNANGEYIYHAKIDTAANNMYITEVAGTEGEDYFSFKNCGTNENDWGTRFIRIAGFLSGTAADVIITRNQPIG